nr:MAG TPA: hypothetical protein [Caudoviricetes sp.]
MRGIRPMDRPSNPSKGRLQRRKNMRRAKATR